MTADAFTDQLNAASRDAQRILKSFDTAGTGVRYVEEAAAGPFARKLVDGIRKARRRGWMRSCRHLPGAGPQPCWLFGWKPDRLYCTRCAGAEQLRIAGTPEDSRCDICRRQSPTLWTMRAAVGSYLVHYGACKKCYAVETASGWAA